MYLRLLLPFILLVPTAVAHAQSCNPASLYYIVRNEKGAVLTKAELETVYDQLPKQIDDASVSISEVSFAPDRKTYYWPESVEWETGTKVPALLFSNAATCTMNLRTVELKYRGKVMHLVFNVEITRSQDDRRQVVDSRKFQNGFFVLDLTRRKRHRDLMIPASHWARPRM